MDGGDQPVRKSFRVKVYMREEIASESQFMAVLGKGKTCPLVEHLTLVTARQQTPGALIRSFSARRYGTEEGAFDLFLDSSAYGQGYLQGRDRESCPGIRCSRWGGKRQRHHQCNHSSRRIPHDLREL